MKRVPALPRVGLILLAVCLNAIPSETNHNFARWEKEIAAYEQMDGTNPPPRGGIVFIGSSTIRRWTTLPRDFPEQPVLNRGFGGSEIADSTYFADRLIVPYQPKMVFLRAGGNDIFAGKSPEQVFADFKEFVTKIRHALPQTEILFISLSPSISRWSQASKEKTLNEMVKAYAQTMPGVKYIETYDLPLGLDGQPRPELFVSDKLHFSPAGYKLLVERIRPWLPPIAHNEPKLNQ
jgi:lysophospholipase L1-like esterase